MQLLINTDILGPNSKNVGFYPLVFTVCSNSTLFQRYSSVKYIFTF